MNDIETNYYKSPDGKPLLVKSVAAFIDILGYTEYIKTSFKNGTGNQELIRLREALDSAYRNLKMQAGEIDSYSDKRIKVRTFTDCLIIGYPIHEPIQDYDRCSGEMALSTVISYVAYFQAEMARQGYLIRGAITVGDLYIDDDIVFGQALIETVEAEKQLAIYPRVILCQNAVDEIKPHWSDRKLHDLLVDSDNHVFIDYLDATVMIAYPDDRPFTEFLEGNKACIVRNLHEFKSKPYVRSKYEWAAGYHNTFCESHPDLFTDIDKIDIALISQKQKPFICQIQIE